MSIDVAVHGTLDTAKAIISNTTTTTLLTGGESKFTVQWVRVTVAGSTDTVTLDIHDGTTAYRLTSALSVTGGASTTLELEFPLRNGESLRITAGAGNTIHCIVCYSISGP